MENRTVLQWDKDDCAAVGLVKFDLLGLGMLSALHYAVDLIRDAHGVGRRPGRASPRRTRSTTCCAGPTRSGCSRSRAGPRWPPCLASSPGTSTTWWWRWPSSGPGRSRAGRCTPTSVGATARSRSPTCTRCSSPAWPRPWGSRCSRSSSCRWPSTWPASRRARPTSCARPWGPSAAASAWSGCAHGSTRAWPTRGITGDVADQIFDKLAAFANFGFPESHSVSFAYLVYSSSWIKLHYPAAFCAALLNAQPMGFYSPHTLVQDARRHGVEVLTPDLNRSGAKATLEPGIDPDHPRLRLSLSSVRNVGDDLAERIVAERDAGGSLPRHGGPAAAGADAPGRARGAGHGRGLRMLRRSPGGGPGSAPGAVGGGGGGPDQAETAWPEWSPGCTPPSCRG